jgi:hypothetical protein
MRNAIVLPAPPYVVRLADEEQDTEGAKTGDETTSPQETPTVRYEHLQFAVFLLFRPDLE